jgi:hypothetical protein
MRALLSVTIGIAALAAVARQPRESVSCQSNIVSSTVVATFCGHRQADEEVLDLLILWRGTPGWFQRGSGGGGGSRTFGAGTNGQVSQYEAYGDVTIAFAANFDTKVVMIGPSTVPLDHINTVMIDDVDGNWGSPATQWTEPRLPLAGDWNVALVRRSSALLRYLRCDVPMPQARVSYPGPRLPIVTVCEKLNNK